MNARRRFYPKLRTAWFAIIMFSISSLFLSSPCWSSIAVAAATEDDATMIHEHHQPQQIRRSRRRRREGSQANEHLPIASFSRSLIECATAYSIGTDYAAGDIVSRKGKNYQCKPHPYSLWCSNGSYAPGGDSGYWSEAWIVSIFFHNILALIIVLWNLHSLITRKNSETSCFLSKNAKPPSKELRTRYQRNLKTVLLKTNP